MNKQIDLIITETKEKLVSVINECKLPITITSMILHEISGIVDSNIPGTIEKQKKEYEEGVKREAALSENQIPKEAVNNDVK